MPITPLDIKKKAFSTQLRGWSKAEVAAFLAQVANEMEELRKERALLAEKVDEVTARLETYEKTERLLQDTLVTAQRATDDLKEAARHESETLVAEARVKAQELLLQSEQQLAHARDELRQLEHRKSNLIDEIKGIAHSYLSMSERHGSQQNIETEDTGERPGNSE